MRKYLFDDWGSVWHAILGFLLGAFAPFVVMLLVTAVFLVYEVAELEDPVSTVGDVVEFWSGFNLGLALHIVPFL